MLVKSVVIKEPKDEGVWGERRHSSNSFEPYHYVELSSQLRAPVIFLPVNPAKECSCGLNTLDRKILSSLP